MKHKNRHTYRETQQWSMDQVTENALVKIVS